jgi:hypothetical protein
LKISSFIAAFALLAAVSRGADAPQFVEPQLAPNVADRWALSFPRDQDGFTIFPLGEGARIILISSSDGSDFYDGMIQPVRTLKKALTLVRNGSPDRILFKRGDVFREAGLDVNIEKQGRSALEPLIIGAYGSTRLPRPSLYSHLSLGAKVEPRYLVLQSLDLFADTRDPTQRSTFSVKKMSDHQNFGIGLISPGRFLWIEDCRIRDFGMGLVLEAPLTNYFDTLILRRCQILDSWAFGMSSGIYLENFQNVLIDENIFDHNGWADLPGAGKTMFNHDMYLQHGHMGEDRHITVRDNIIARAASHGCQLRPGGLLEGNLFLKNPLGAFMSFSPSIARNNVVLDGDSIAPGLERGQGLEFLNCYQALAEGNIIAHKPDKRNGQEGLAFYPEGRQGIPAPTVGIFRHNIVYDWAGPAFFIVSQPAGLEATDNFFEQTDNPDIFLHDWQPKFIFQNNHYSSQMPQPFRIGQKFMDLATWESQTGEKPNTAPAKFVDPNRDIATYAKSINLEDHSLEGFITAARDQRRGHWDARLTAQAVNQYIRDGFAIQPH